MSTSCSSAAWKLAIVLPGATRSAPLWPTRFIADTRGTSTWCGCRRPDRAPGSASCSAGTVCVALVDLDVLREPARDRRLHERAHSVDHRQRLVVGYLAQLAPWVDG